MKKAELIFIPLPGTSHLAPTLEFAKRLTDRDDRISITVLVMKLPFGNDQLTKSLGTNTAASHSTSIRFIDLPQVDDLPPSQLLMTSPASYFSLFTEKHKPHVRNIIRDIIVSSSNNSVRVTGLVVDWAFVSMVDVAIEINLPCYAFSPFNAGYLSLFRYLSTRYDDDRELQSSDSDLIVPGFVNPVPVSVLPPGLFNRDDYIAYFKIVQRLQDVNGIIANTFSELEQYSVNSFSCGGRFPHVYTVGPLLNQIKGPPANNNSDLDGILKWLDDQPECSVVFLCFGTAGSFSPAQVKEIATGLEQSECRFLWSLRVSSPPPHDHQSTTTNGDDLPEGFMERVRGRGMVIRGWAPQAEVLAHKAIGGFVSHCGWNSIMESLWHGVPIVTWPLYAEQHFNAFTLVKELGLSVEIMDSRKDHDDHIVMGDEIARAVRCVMDGDSDIRKKVKEMSGIGRKSTLEGGSSFDSIGQFIESLTANSQSRIRFIDVPEVDPPPMQLPMTSPETYFFVFTEKNTPHVRKIVEDILSDSDSNDDSVRVTGLVTDIGFLRMIDVAIELGLPSYSFLASNIGFLSLMSYLSTRHDHDQMGSVEFQSFLDTELVTLPGFVNPVHVSVMPSGFLNKDSYTIYVQVAHRLKNVNSIIVNTFFELESYALNSFSGGSNSYPPVYTVGPLLDLQVHQANLDNSENSQKNPEMAR
ncbi:hypothetical protein EZV62_002937 [Acer yangbiense]|uniref:Uncharacterized protein n=1 Tax=Acer yangbiense TaxID=1000413 RepID=A0A5C7IZ03_9ROSI|nr:hypothetical protein EZV62_002937 [Acer yangbiense]